MEGVKNMGGENCASAGSCFLPFFSPYAEVDKQDGGSRVVSPEKRTPRRFGTLNRSVSQTPDQLREATTIDLILRREIVVQGELKKVTTYIYPERAIEREAWRVHGGPEGFEA